MKSYRLEITTPEGTAFAGDVVQLSVRAVDGELAVLADHIPLATALREGECRVYLPEGEMKRAKSSGGMLLVSKEKTQLLCSIFEWL